MRRRRIERVNQLVRQELARLLQEEVKDPRVTSVTVTRVEVTADLMYATVFVRTLTPEIPVEKAIEGLESAEGFVRRRLGQELRLRRIPDLRFRPDRALEHVQRIETLLDRALGTDDGPAETE